MLKHSKKKSFSIFRVNLGCLLSHWTFGMIKFILLRENSIWMLSLIKKEILIQIKEDLSKLSVFLKILLGIVWSTQSSKNLRNFYNLAPIFFGMKIKLYFTIVEELTYVKNNARNVL